MAIAPQLSNKGNANYKPGRGLVSNRELNQLFRKVNNIQSSNETLLSVRSSTGGIVLTPKPSSNIGTPFAGTISADQLSIIIGVDRAKSSYKYIDRLIFGTTTYTKTVAETIILTSLEPVFTFVEVGYLVTDTVLNPGTLTITLQQGASAQTDAQMFLAIGRAEFLNSLIIGWTQYQIGMFHFPARIF